MTRAVLADFADFRALHERRSAMEEAKQERQKSKSEKQDEKVIIVRLLSIISGTHSFVEISFPELLKMGLRAHSL